MHPATRVQIQDEAACISLSGNTLEKSINPTNVPPAIGKIIGHIGLFNLGMATNLGNRKL